MFKSWCDAFARFEVTFYATNFFFLDRDDFLVLLKNRTNHWHFFWKLCFVLLEKRVLLFNKTKISCRFKRHFDSKKHLTKFFDTCQKFYKVAHPNDRARLNLKNINIKNGHFLKIPPTNIACHVSTYPSLNKYLFIHIKLYTPLLIFRIFILWVAQTL